uniref:Uncharacterized protein n=1 Tax=Leersia perrieri TaxID=77586 RepID=A0A0D9VVF4_9ORYZ
MTGAGDGGRRRGGGETNQRRLVAADGRRGRWREQQMTPRAGMWRKEQEQGTNARAAADDCKIRDVADESESRDTEQGMTARARAAASAIYGAIARLF